MATIVQENDNGIAASSQTTITTSLTGVASGNCIALFAKMEDVNATITVSDGTDSFTPGTKQGNPGGTSYGQWFYLLSSSSGNKTYTVTFNIATNYPSVFVYEISGTGTWSFGTEATNSNASSNAPSSGNMTVTSTDGVCLGGWAEFTIVTTNSATINGVAAGRLDTCVNNYTATCASVLTGTFTGAAAFALSAATTWACCGIALYVTAGGGGANNYYYRANQ